MRLSIIVPDSTVIIDGRAETVDLKDMPKGTHAVQWDGYRGHTEYVNLGYGEFRSNTVLEDIDEYEWVIDAWKEAALESDRKEQEIRDNIDKINQGVASQAEREGRAAGPVLDPPPPSKEKP